MIKINNLKLFSPFIIIVTLIAHCFIIKPSCAEMTIVNIKKHVYHKTDCKIAQKCKKNCLLTTKERALEIYKARPCKSCYKMNKNKY